MSETFTTVPAWAWEHQAEHNVLVTEFESGKEQRRYKGTMPREWNLTFVGSKATIDTVLAFFDTVKGPYTAFSWTPPGAASAVTVRFKENTLTPKYEGLKTGTIECTFREVLT